MMKTRSQNSISEEELSHIPMPSQNLILITRTPKSSPILRGFCTGLGKTLSFCLSHIGLLSLVVGYCLLGAVVFEELERENEILVKRNVTETRTTLTEELWSMIETMDVLHQEEWNVKVTLHLRNFEKKLLMAIKENGWNGDESEEKISWNFSGGLFYSITVITTIGYGHIAPKTPMAKIVTIFYAICGIPLTVLCWSNIGDAMANAFRFFYWRVFCYICTRKPKDTKCRKKKRERGSSIRTFVKVPSIRRSLRHSSKSQDSAPSIEDSMSRNDIIFEDEKFKAQEIHQSCRPEFGIDDLERRRKRKEESPFNRSSISGRILERNSKDNSEQLESCDSTCVSQPLQCHASSTRLSKQSARIQEEFWSHENKIDKYYSGFRAEEDYSRKSVPIWLSICLVIAYIIAGAYIFRYWEGWSLLDSAYFCFITLTTIGFGDLVPDQKTDDGEIRITLCSLYLLFGIALIAMSFNLVQEEVISSFKNLGKRLGIIKDSENENEKYYDEEEDEEEENDDNEQDDENSF